MEKQPLNQPLMGLDVDHDGDQVVTTGEFDVESTAKFYACQVAMVFD